MKRKLSVLLLAATCAVLDAHTAASGTLSTPMAPRTYTNPVLGVDFPDPAIVRLPDGSFAAYATGGASHTGPYQHIQCATSPDLVSWTLQPDALPKLPSWACQDCYRSCAPDVQLHDGVFYMYFLAYLNGTTRNCIGVATSTAATGPFAAPTPETDAQPLLCDGDNGAAAMDPRSYNAPDGRIFLYFGSHKRPIMAAQLNASRIALATGPAGVPATVLDPDRSAYGGLVEGPWVYADPAGRLTMWYSGSQCCGTAAHYAASVAVSLSGDPFGPWSKLGGPTGNGSVVLQSDSVHAHVTAPGHNAVIRDDAGTDWLLYHANAGPQCNQSYCPRLLFLDRIWYNATDPATGSGGWPWTAGPSWTPQAAPVIHTVGSE